MAIEEIREHVEVPLEMERAFSLFVDDFFTWWPFEYTWAGEQLTWIGMEAEEGGHCYELGPHGFRLDWGRVVEFRPPERLAFLWQIGADRVPQPNPETASRVELTFESGGAGTRVTLIHSDFERHGAGAEGYRAGMASPEGWRYILERYSSAAS